MAKTFCVMPKQANEFIAKLRRREIDVTKLLSIKDAERSAYIKSYFGKDTAKVSKLIEKNLVSEVYANALKSQIRESKYLKQPAKTAITVDLEKSLKNGLLTEENINNIIDKTVSQSLGQYLTNQQREVLTKKVNAVKTLSQKDKDEFGLESIEYWKARRSVEKYLRELNPSSKTEVLTGIVARGNMLFNVKSATTNIISNTSQMVLTSLERMIKTVNIKGCASDLASDLSKRLVNIYSESGFDLTRMVNLDSINNVLGEKTVHGSGKVSQFYEDVVFNKLMTTPDVRFAAFAFTNSLNLNVTRQAQIEGLEGEQAVTRAKALFLEAANPAVGPNTTAYNIRQTAIADAAFATYTNDSLISKAALYIRNGLNRMDFGIDGLRLGDLAMPFVKTPANVVAAGLDFSGLGLIKGLVQIASAKGDKVKISQGVTSAVRAGVGFTLAAIIASAIDPEDFEGAYPAGLGEGKEREMYRMGNRVANSIKIGDLWVSLDYFGPLAPAIVGFMSAKKYGDGTKTQVVVNFVSGASSQLMEVPGVDTIIEGGAAIKNAIAGVKEEGGVEDLKNEVSRSTVDFILSRSIPSFTTDIGKAMDSHQRAADYFDLEAQVKARIPGLRQTLDIKTDSYGNQLTEENPLFAIFFGSRVKTSNTGEIYKELSRLEDSGNLPAIMDLRKSSSTWRSFYDQVDESTYQQATAYMRVNVVEKTIRLLQTGRYQRANDEEKAKMWDEIRSEWSERALKKFGYRKQ